MEDSRNIIKAIDALTLKAGGEVVDSKNITEAIDNLKEVYSQEAIGIDDTLTQEGLAADAKAVGDLIKSSIHEDMTQSNVDANIKLDTYHVYTITTCHPFFEDAYAIFVASMHPNGGSIVKIGGSDSMSASKQADSNTVIIHSDQGRPFWYSVVHSKM